MKTRQQLGSSKRWVIKVGSSLVTRDGKGLDHDQIRDWVEQICALRSDGHQVVLVSSGSVAEGLVRGDAEHAPFPLVRTCAGGERLLLC